MWLRVGIIGGLSWTATNLLVPLKVVGFLDKLATASFSARTLLHPVLIY
jgi:hypothetical protein